MLMVIMLCHKHCNMLFSLRNKYGFTFISMASYLMDINNLANLLLVFKFSLWKTMH